MAVSGTIGGNAYWIGLRWEYQFGRRVRVPVFTLMTPHSYPESELLWKGRIGVQVIHRISGLKSFTAPTPLTHELRSTDYGFAEWLYWAKVDEVLSASPQISYRLLPTGLMEAHPVSGPLGSEWSMEKLEVALKTLNSLETLISRR